ncbi:hypothetical protein SASPL_136923 [Salvia splendens]|uniref:Cystatin domain-containing protein n=1 Tax=Salvia splendens TaxID=180675 RepID=A0A8X8WZ43_SALSN|nr:cysteine proteinase inhibitor 1-like [Salvia splendens]KAG6404670.1 hypothetical protein SASPL_136923 [Salvia splendens]
MASSLTMTASASGGAVAAKPAAATTRHGPLAVRASMELEKAVEKRSNTRRCLMLAVAGAAAVSSVTKVAMADDKNTSTGDWTDIPDLSPPEIFLIGTFAVSEYNKQKNASLILESMLKAETQVVEDEKTQVVGVNYRLLLSARDNLRPSGTYQAVVYYQYAQPTSLQLSSFVGISR